MNNTHETLASFQRQLIDAIDRQDWAGVKELTSPHVRVHVTGQDLDWDGWQAQGKAFYSAFPDGKHEIQQVVVEADRVVMRGLWRGTHQGAFNGLPASGRRVGVDLMFMDRVVDGRLVERWGVFDAMGLLQQIGAIPGPPK